MTDRLARLARSLGRATSSFLTGGSGFVGQTVLDLCARLRSETNLGIRVTVLTRAPGEFLDVLRALPGTAVDRAQRRSLRHAFPRSRPALLPCVACGDRHDARRPDRIALVHHLVDGTERALEFARRSAARGFLFKVRARSTAGRRCVAPIAEDSPARPRSDRRDERLWPSQRLAEHLCALYAADRGVRARIARCFAFADERLLHRTDRSRTAISSGRALPTRRSKSQEMAARFAPICTAMISRSG